MPAAEQEAVMHQGFTDQNNLPSQPQLAVNQFFSGSHNTGHSQSVNSFCVGGSGTHNASNSIPVASSKPASCQKIAPYASQAAASSHHQLESVKSAKLEEDQQSFKSNSSISSENVKQVQIDQIYPFIDQNIKKVLGK